MPFYLQLSKIRGSCTDPKYSGWIRLDGYSFVAGATAQYVGRQLLPNKILRIIVPKSDTAYLRLTEAIAKGLDVGPAVLRNVPDPGPGSQMARVMLNLSTQIVQYKLAPSAFVNTTPTPHPRITYGSDATSTSGAFDLVYAQMSESFTPA